VAASAVLVITAAAAGLAVAGLPHHPAREASLAVGATPDRVAHGRRLVGLMCAGCHRDQATGTLSGRPVEDVPPVFGRFASANITRDPEYGIGGWTDGQLVYLFRTGIRRDGRQAAIMPSSPGLSDEDLASILAFYGKGDAAPTFVERVAEFEGADRRGPRPGWRRADAGREVPGDERTPPAD
jgi:mono/diheme cytochrome c family protein